jgi:uncharacterized protein (DUF1501 family)
MSKATSIGCRDFSRSSLLRESLATAGRGLPTIEPGMPEPAGTGLSRRSLMLRSAGLAATVFGAGALAPQAFEEGIAEAAAASTDSPILVSIFLSGGLDSLTLLAPVADSTYRSLRPTLANAPSGNSLNTFTEDDRLEWHPSAAGLRDLHLEGKLSVVPGVGWSSSHGSHFTSRHFWEVGALDTGGRFGWLGRYLDRHGAPDNPLQGLTLETYMLPALAAAKSPIATMGSPELFNVGFNAVAKPAILNGAKAAYRKLGQLDSGGDVELASARSASANLGQLADQVLGFQGQKPPWQTEVTYPSGVDFATRLSTLAEMIGRGLPLRCVALQGYRGYDTHAAQSGALATNLKVVSDSLLAFQRDLERRGLADRVITHVWSEFGRRVKENGSGTDHGAAGVSLFMGTRVKGTMIGEFPGVTQLDELGNLRTTTDYRALYCSMLEQWLGVDAAEIIPGAAGFARPQLLKA